MSDDYTIRLPVLRSLGETSPTLLLPSSPKTWRRSAETLAYYFKREFHYDFPQFEAAEQPTSREYVPYEAWLFHDIAWDLVKDIRAIPRRIIGAACFRWREEEDPPAWMLDWVWFHPYERRRGNLQRAWKTFQERYGMFPVEHPLSEAMKAFLQKVGHRPPAT